MIRKWIVIAVQKGFIVILRRKTAVCTSWWTISACWPKLERKAIHRCLLFSVTNVVHRGGIPGEWNQLQKHRKGHQQGTLAVGEPQMFVTTVAENSSYNSYVYVYKFTTNIYTYPSIVFLSIHLLTLYCYIIADLYNRIRHICVCIIMYSK